MGDEGAAQPPASHCPLNVHRRFHQPELNLHPASALEACLPQAMLQSRQTLRRKSGESFFLSLTAHIGSGRHTGEVEGIIITVVWTPRGRRRRIVSARPASIRERHEYREAIQRSNSGE